MKSASVTGRTIGMSAQSLCIIMLLWRILLLNGRSQLSLAYTAPFATRTFQRSSQAIIQQYPNIPIQNKQYSFQSLTSSRRFAQQQQQELGQTTSLRYSNRHNTDRQTAVDQTPSQQISEPSGQEINQVAPWEKELNEAQIEAVTKPLYSVTRVVAGPGSGKTRVLTSRIAYLLKEDPNARILAVTFTRKAAGEMQQRLERLLKTASPSISSTSTHNHALSDSSDTIIEEEEFSEGASSSTYVRDLSRATLGTFHKICADILRYNGNLLASLPSIQHEMIGRNATMLDGSFMIMDQSDQLRIMKECIAEQSIDLQKSGAKPIQVLNALCELKSSIMKGEDPFRARSEKTRKIPKQIEIALAIYGRYRETMLSNNLLDFDDLIYLTREMLMENQEIRQQLHRRWTHILVDEYQDTSRAQIDLVRLWTSSSLLVVGDGDQSIYSWRGADPNSLSTFEDEFKNFLGDIETVHLTDNYRSTANIVKAAQKVIASGEKSLAEKLRQKMTPKRGSGSTPRIVACADGKAEANFVVKTIKNKLARGEYTEDTTVAVLYRTNAQSRMMEEACVKSNLPYVILGKATSFYKRREVKDCLCFLRWLYNGRDRGSMIRAFQTPSRGLGEKAIEQFDQYYALVEEHRTSTGKARPTPLDVLLSFQAPEEEGFPLRRETIATRPLKLFTEFSRQMQSLRDLAYTEPVENVLAASITQFDLMSHFDKISDSKAEFQERQGNVQELQQATRRYTQDGPSLQDKAPLENETGLDSIKSPLGNFLDDVALVTETSDESQQDTKNKRFVLSLMTIHAAKGMEYDAVFVVGNEDDNFPTSQAIQAGKGSVALAEECRLCYVAMTRAKSDLFLTWRREAAVFTPNSEYGFRIVKRNRSRFLEALVAKKEKGKRSESPTKRNGSSSDGQVQHSQRSPYSTTASKSAPRWQDRNGQTRSISGSRTFVTSRDIPTRRKTSSSAVKALQQQPSTRPSRDIPTPRRNTPSSFVNPSVASRQEKPKRARRKTTTMDSTWFFPVGSTVVHKKHGRGLVLNPPPPSQELLVRVKFEDGQRMDIPAQGDELKPDF